MSMDDTRAAIVADIVEALAPQVTAIVSKHVRNVAAEGPLQEAIRDIVAGWIDDRGPAAATELTRKVMDAFRWKTRGLSDLPLTAEELTRLTDLMQTQEAEALTQARRWTNELWVFLGTMGPVLVSAVGRALAAGK